jgi:hypothetical protein
VRVIGVREESDVGEREEIIETWTIGFFEFDGYCRVRDKFSYRGYSGAENVRDSPFEVNPCNTFGIFEGGN